MENLTEQQKVDIAQAINRYKFTEIAAQVGCTVEAVEQFAPEVFAARKAAQEAAQKAAWEAERKEADAKNAEIAKLLATGDEVGAYEVWKEWRAEEVIGDVLERNDDTRDELIEAHVEEYVSDQLQEDMLEALDDEIKEAVEEAWQEYRGDAA
jgi:hypothetical protein